MSMEIEFAESRAGHDRNQIYLVKEKDEDSVYLVDGVRRTLAAPKRKNRKHVQMIRRLPAEVTACLADGQTDITIKRAIKIYLKFRNQKQEDL